MSSQVSLEEDRKKRNQDEPRTLDKKYGKSEPEKSDVEASTSEKDGAHKGRRTSVAEVRLASGPCVRSGLLHGLPSTHLLVSSLTCRSRSQSP